MVRAMGTGCVIALISAGALADDAGFKTIFNGKDLTGWDGRPDFWTVQNGHIRGQTTPQKKAPGNTFLIWRDGKMRNFELKLKYRILTGNNSGVQYRSEEVGQWVVSGYQSEVENRVGKTGFLYHEKGRGWLVDVGDFMHIDPAGKKTVVGICADRNLIITAPYHTDNQWNEYHFVVRGNHIVHNLNGFQTVELIDDHVDPKNPKSLNHRRNDGVLALQLHAGSPMTVDFKDIRYKHLPDDYADAKLLFNGKDLSGWEANRDNADKHFGVVSFEHNGASFKRRGANATVIGGALQCSGKGGGGGLTPTMKTPKAFVLRYQWRPIERNSSDVSRTPRGIHQVQRWRLAELHVDGEKVSRHTNGLPATSGAILYYQGKILIPSSTAVQYRNLVLIPIGSGG
ncbi:MAG: DUF1080 domain-containing protein [Phycisphaerae bacterium]|nr:DUF1080 domain-containing protein [Phycisphaerae bacterium]